MTTSVLFGVGDIVAQQAVEKKGFEKHELVRTGRMALYGGGKLYFLLIFFLSLLDIYYIFCILIFGGSLRAPVWVPLWEEK